MCHPLLRVLLAGIAALMPACSSSKDDPGAEPPVAARPLTVAWYGDSVIDNVCEGLPPPAALAALLGPSWTVVDHAVGGEFAPNIRKRYEDSWATACQGQACEWYLIQGGMNSLKGNPHVTPEEALADMVAIVDAARARYRRVVWFGILPFKGCALCTEDTSPGVVRARQYNALMAQACAQRPDVTCVLLYSEFEDPARPDFMRPEYSCDGIHFNQLGAQRFATEVRARLPR